MFLDEASVTSLLGDPGVAVPAWFEEVEREVVPDGATWGRPDDEHGRSPRAGGAVAPGGGAALDNNANNAPASERARILARRSRIEARRVLWSITSLDRVRQCGRTPHDSAGVAVVVSEGPAGQRVAGFRGLSTCGSVWACPRCSAVVAHHRAEELRGGFEAWRQAGGAVALLTLTMRHRASDRLSDLWDALAGAWSRLLAGRPWKRFKVDAGLVGTLRVVEVTHGVHGWHAHIHAVLFLDPAASARSRDTGEGEFGAHFAAMAARGPVLDAWRRLLAARGYDVVEDAQDMRPVNLGEAESSLTTYFRKSGWDAAAEITGGARKRARRSSRTPMQLLHDLVGDSPESRDLALWREWEQASHGRRQMTWSRGLRGLLGLASEVTDVDLVDQLDGAETDEELAATSRGDAEVYLLTADEWRVIRRCRAEAAVLEAAERHVDPSCGVVAIVQACQQALERTSDGAVTTRSCSAPVLAEGPEREYLPHRTTDLHR